MYIVNFITFKFNDLQYIPVYNFDIINVLLVLTNLYYIVWSFSQAGLIYLIITDVCVSSA